MKKTAIVILNWNGKEFLNQFLPQVISYSPGAEIYVADNASSDGSVAFVQSNFPQVKLVVNQQNGGFAKGYNDALKEICADYYLLLNSDVEVSENWLEPLLAKMESNPNIAGCQPKVLSYKDRKRFEHAGASGGFLDHNFYPFCRGRILDVIEEDKGQYDGEAEIFWATGACMLIRADLFHKVGGFDETFFAHMEEIDLCWRIKKLGYQFFVCPSSVVYHVGGGTLDYLSPKKTYLNFRNSLFMITKNYPGPLFPKLFYRMCLDGAAAGMFLATFKPKHFWAVFTAHVDYYKRFGEMYDKRKHTLQSDREATHGGFYRGSILWARYFKRVALYKNLNLRLFSKTKLSQKKVKQS